MSRRLLRPGHRLRDQA